MNTNYQIKRKIVSDKDIIDFLTMLEDKYENNSQKLQSFVEIFNKYNNSNEEVVLSKLRDILSEHPVLILELNKMLPKTNKLPLVDQENADQFLLKIKYRDESIFQEILRLLLNFKKGDLTQEKLISKCEELLMKFPDLLEEAYLYLDYKRISNSTYKKNLMNKLSQSKSDSRRGFYENKNSFNGSKYKESTTTPIKIQSSPEYIYFDSLKTIFDQVKYSSVIKLLHLYNEGVLNYSELIELCEPFFIDNLDIFDYFKTLTHSKIMNRRNFSLINKPLSEIDLSKSSRICTSYSELPKNYPNLICSGRTEEIAKIMNDRFISIPTGSEDDKNTFKKNNYEEHIFKFEDQRYEIDMVLEILKFALEEINELNEKVLRENLETVKLETALGSSTIRFISFLYKEYAGQVLQGIRTHPKNTISIVINRLKKRIEEALNQKSELEKNIKLSFDRFYYKAFDHRSFKLKNFEKKSNNSKAFIKEMSIRKKEKLITNNINVLKGGNEDLEFYSSIKIKYAKENINKLLSSKSYNKNNNILLPQIQSQGTNLENASGPFDQNLRKKLPELKIIFENMEIFKITISLIFYQIYYSNMADSQKLAEILTQIFEHLFKLGVNQLNQMLFSTKCPVINDRDCNYLEMIDKIKNKCIDPKEIEKYYKIDLLAENILELDSVSEYFNNNDKLISESLINNKEPTPDNHSEISLTPSLQSQDTGKTYKDIIIIDEDIENLEGDVISNPDRIQSINNNNYQNYLPRKEKDHVLFLTNENCFVLIRFIYCIYERINKLYDYSSNFLNENSFSVFPGIAPTNKATQNTLNANSNENTPSNNCSTFKIFIVIYKALIHKKIENISVYEELCRDILGNESYFLFNLDKLINSLIKTIGLLSNDALSKEVVNLFLNEKNRKNSVCEALYYSNFIKLCESANSSCYRVIYSSLLNVMTINLIECSYELKKEFQRDLFKDYESFQQSYQKLEEENLGQDELNLNFLLRNKRLMKRRSSIQPDYFENNLLSKFNINTKRIEFIKSGCDVLFFSKRKLDKKQQMKILFKRNLSRRMWNESKI